MRSPGPVAAAAGLAERSIGLLRAHNSICAALRPVCTSYCTDWAASVKISKNPGVTTCGYACPSCGQPSAPSGHSLALALWSGRAAGPTFRYSASCACAASTNPGGGAIDVPPPWPGTGNAVGDAVGVGVMVGLSATIGVLVRSVAVGVYVGSAVGELVSMIVGSSALVGTA